MCRSETKIPSSLAQETSRPEKTSEGHTAKPQQERLEREVHRRTIPHTCRQNPTCYLLLRSNSKYHGSFAIICTRSSGAEGYKRTRPSHKRTTPYRVKTTRCPPFRYSNHGGKRHKEQELNNITIVTPYTQPQHDMHLYSTHPQLPLVLTESTRTLPSSSHHQPRHTKEHVPRQGPVLLLLLPLAKLPTGPSTKRRPLLSSPYCRYSRRIEPLLLGWGCHGLLSQ